LASPAESAFIIVAGELEYNTKAEKQLVNAGGWVSEAALWVHWVHVGLMEAVSASDAIAVSVGNFEKVVVSSPECARVFRSFAEAYHTRILQACLHGEDSPTDLEMPSCGFEAILPSLLPEIHAEISSPALRHLSSFLWKRPDCIGHVRKLEREVMEKKCMLAFAADGEVERLVAVCALQLTEVSSGAFLAEVGVWKGESLSVSCKLPGTKHRDGETAVETINRLVQMLAPYDKAIIWSERGCKSERKSKMDGIHRTVYFRSTYQASLDESLPNVHAAAQGLELLPFTRQITDGCSEIRPFVLARNPAEVGAADSGVMASSAGTSQPGLNGEDFKIYAWVTDDVFKYLQSDSGHKQLTTCLNGLPKPHLWATGDVQGQEHEDPMIQI